MAAADLPSELWIIVGLIAGLTVVMCLGVLASQMQHERSVRKLRHDIEKPGDGGHRILSLSKFQRRRSLTLHDRSL